MLLIENAGIEVGQVPKDVNGVVSNGQYISLKNFNHVSIIIKQGAWAGGTPAVTLTQATTIAGAGAKAAPIPFQWQKAGITPSTFARTAVVADTFNLPATANTITVLELDAEQLDAQNDFDCVRVNVASPGAVADLLDITYILSEPRFKAASLSDAKID